MPTKKTAAKKTAAAQKAAPPKEAPPKDEPLDPRILRIEATPTHDIGFAYGDEVYVKAVVDKVVGQDGATPVVVVRLPVADGFEITSATTATVAPEVVFTNPDA